MEEEKENIREEEISIDFGKIRNIFRKKGNEEKEEKGIERKEEIVEEVKERTEEGKKEEPEKEISFDFSRIKGIFKKGEAKEDKEEEISFNIKKGIETFNKNRWIILPIAFIIIAMFFSIYIRAQPAYLPIVDDWAKSSVNNFFRDQIKAEVNKQYPNLPDRNKLVLLDREYNNFLEENKGLVQQQISSTADFFKSELQDDAGQTYLLAIDPYFWMRHSRNVLENGHPGDTIKDGVSWDDHMYAPLGRPIPFDMFHAYFEAHMFKVMRIFSPDMSLMTAAFYMPIIISALTVIPAFFIARRLGGNLGGFIAALIVAVHPAFVTRTAGGFADTDAYNVFFPLFIAWFFLIAFETKDVKKKWAYTILAGFLVGLYSFAWGGWWYIFDFLVVSAVLYLVYYILVHYRELRGIGSAVKKPAVKNTLILLLLFILTSAIFVSIFVDVLQFKTAYENPLGFAKLKQVAITTVWPNVFTTVAEQNPASLEGVINQIGFGGKSNGRFFFAIAIIGIILSSIRRDIYGKVDVKYAILLALWFAATIYASTKGIRFTLLVVPAFAIAVGVAFGIAYNFIVKWGEKGLHVNKMIIGVVLIAIIILVFLVNPVKAGIAVGKQEIPSMNDAWYRSLNKINQEAAPDAIINSWWDFGHWFKAIGDRAVTFDGTSQNSPQAHWVGKVLMTNDEKQAIGILRMLDCGADMGFTVLDRIINDPAKSVGILNEIIVLDKESARKALESQGISDPDSVLVYTHCEPPEDYFITSDDMIQKSGVWGHFGSWNFDKATIYFKLQKKGYKDKEKAIAYLQERFNYTESEAEDVYFDVKSLGAGGGKAVNDWIAPWPGYVSGVNGCDRISEEEVVCGIIQEGQAKINLVTMDVEIPSNRGVLHPNSISYVDGDDVVEKVFTENTIGYSMALIPAGDSFQNVMMSPQLAAGMFTRLFYFKGHGLEHFKLFSFERSPVGGATIYVWKVDWNGREKNIVNEYITKERILEEQTTGNETEKAVEEGIERSNVTENVSI